MRDTKAVIPMTASEVPWASCCEVRRTPVRSGIITKPPPTPNSPPAVPARQPPRKAPRRSREDTLRLRRRGAGIDRPAEQAQHVGEPGGVGGRTQYHRDQVA